MIEIAESLVVMDQETLDIVRRAYRERAPAHPSTKKVLALEEEAREYRIKPVAEVTETKQIKQKRVVKKKKRQLVNMDNYKYPLVRVTNLDGKLLRYEDAEGLKLPEELWPGVGAK